MHACIDPSAPRVGRRTARVILAKGNFSTSAHLDSLLHRLHYCAGMGTGTILACWMRTPPLVTQQRAAAVSVDCPQLAFTVGCTTHRSRLVRLHHAREPGPA